MPKLMRQVEQDVDVSVLTNELADYADNEILGEGAFFKNPDGSRGEQIVAGDSLVPTEATYQTGMIAPETHVYVVDSIDRAGIIWGAFFTPDGRKANQFFVPEAFASKFVQEPNPLAKSARAAKTATTKATKTAPKTKR